MPSVQQPGSKQNENAVPDVLAAVAGGGQRRNEIPDLLSAFTRAAQDNAARHTSGDDGRPVDNTGHREPSLPDSPPLGRNRDR